MKFIAYLICYCIYPFSFLFPRNRKKWAFGSFRGAFNDNAKYLFVHASEHLPEIKCAWLSISKATVKDIKANGLVAYYILSPKGIWHALTSKYWFFNAYSSDIMFCLSGNAKLVNLWHGLPMKRIEFEITSGPLADRYKKKTLKERYFHPESFHRPDFVVSSTPFFSDIFSRSFRIPEQHCLELGYPRNEILLFSEQERTDYINKYEPVLTKTLVDDIVKGTYQHVFIYMPTWRDSQRDVFVQSFDLNRLDGILKTNNSLLLLKPHANTCVDTSDIKNYQNIIFLDSGTDVYPILPYTDVLITDYSSILYDYILMENHDVILYLYDYDDYLKDRELFYPFDENVVGKRAMNFDELCQCIGQGDFKIDEAQRKMIVEKFWGETMKHSPCEKIVSCFLSTAASK